MMCFNLMACALLLNAWFFSVSESNSLIASLELKPLLDSLKYSLLRSNESLSITIVSDLGRDQEEKLMDLLKDNKEVIGWTLRDQGY